MALSIFDLTINLDIEIKYLQNLKFGILKVAFVLCRLLPICLCAIRFAEDLTPPSAATERCPIFVQAFNWTSVAIMTCAEYIFLARTCALWADNKRVVNVLRIGFLVILIGVLVFTGLMSYLQSATYNVPDSSTHLTGCFSAGKASDVGVVPFVLMLVLELGTFCFTIFKFVKHFRSSSSGRIVTSLVHHSILYFTIALLLVVPVIVADLISFSQGPVFGLIQVVGQAMAVTRMQVHLWAATWHPQVEIPPPVTAIHFARQTGGPENRTASINSDESDLQSFV